MKRIRRNLTFANIVASIALFVALGGASYAATQLPKNSVGAKQLKNAAVTPAKLSAAAKATLTGPTGGQGPTGAPGPKGDPGAQGPPGKVDVSAWHYVGAAGEPSFGEHFSSQDPTDPVRFRLEGDVVRIQGSAISSENKVWGEMTQREVFKLPPGFRPPGVNLILPISSASSLYPAYVFIGSDGGVFLVGKAAGFAEFAGLTFATS